MSKRLEKLLAADTPDDDDKNKPAGTPPADTPPADTPPADTPPADTPPADTPPADTPPADTPPADTPPADTPPANTDDDPDDEDKPATRGALAMLERRLDALVADNSRLRAENAKLAEDVGRLRAMLRDPSYAAAAASATRVPAASDAAPATLSRAQAEEAYAKITDPRERAKFREAHRKELGLR